VATGPASNRLYQAAVIIASLEEEVAAEICRHLDHDTVQRLASEIAALQTVPREVRQRLAQEFVGLYHAEPNLGGRRYAEQLLTKVLGTPTLDEELASRAKYDIETLRSVVARDPHVLWRALENETKQVVAAVVAQLHSPEAASLLQLMPQGLQAEVAYRAANLGLTSPGAVEATTRAIAEATWTATAQQGKQEETGLQFLLDVLQNVDRSTEKQLLQGLKEINGDFTTGLEEQLVTFEDLFNLEERPLQTLLRQVEVQTLARALRGVDDKIKQHALNNLSTRMQEELQQEMELMGQIRASQVEAAQREITNLARKLEEDGEIDLRPEEGEYI